MTPTALAAAPSRATTSITLSWGLLNIPLSVYTGTEETRVSRKEFLLDDPTVSVGRSPVRKDTGEVVDSADVIRMAEASNGTWVPLNDDEIAAATTDRGVAKIVSFVPVEKAEAYLAENQVQVRPKSTKGKPDAAADKAFGLLLSAMRTRMVSALVKVAMRGPARYALLDFDGTLTLIYSADQVREARPLSTHTFSDAELDMAVKLIDTVGLEAPVLVDDTAPVVQAYVDSKALGYEAPAVLEPPKMDDDILSALAASLDAAKAA